MWIKSLLQAYSPLGSPGSWIKGQILKEPLLVEIAKKLNKSPAQVALRWGIQSGHSVLPKSVNESRSKENLSLFDWHIPPDLFSKFTDIHQVRLYTCKPLWGIFINLSTNYLVGASSSKGSSEGISPSTKLIVRTKVLKNCGMMKYEMTYPLVICICILLISLQENNPTCWILPLEFWEATRCSNKWSWIWFTWSLICFSHCIKTKFIFGCTSCLAAYQSHHLTNEVFRSRNLCGT